MESPSPALLLGVPALALIPLAFTIFLLVRYRFEALIGMRYLTRAKPAGLRPRVALGISLVCALAGVTLLFGARAHGWAVAIGAVLLMLGGFGALASATLLRFSVFTTVSATGMALGVAALVVVLAVTGGFRRDFLQRVTSFHGHMVVGLYGEPSVDEAKAELATLLPKLADLPGLVGTGTFAVSVADVSIGVASATLKAIDPTLPAVRTNPLSRWMVQGHLDDLARPATCGASGGARAPAGEEDFVGHLIIGRALAQRIKVAVGECVQLVIPFGRPGQLQPVALPFQVVGLFEMGFHQHDTHLAYIALDDLRQVETARPFIYGLELVFADPLSVGQVMPLVEARVGSSYHVLDWRQLSQGLFSALEAQRVLIGLFILIIILVSAFNLVASLIIIVLTKTREIAILGALGARKGAVLRVFVVSGGVAGLLGTGTGLLAGLAICALLRAYHFRLDAAVYMIPELPIDLNLIDVVGVGGVAQLACLLATIFPVLRARRMAIADGLRHV
jgi:lipoprotein-releasing system permease protein